MRDIPILQRLRAARLRPTIARVSVLQIIAGDRSGRICAENIFREVLARGTNASMGTVYRTLQQLEASGLLLREWDSNRRALYRLKDGESEGASVTLVCRSSGLRVVLADPALHTQLRQAALRAGLDLAGHAVTIEVDALQAVDSGGALAALGELAH